MNQHEEDRTRESVNDAPIGQILIGDVRKRLAELPDASVDCVITSPPYFALRDYGHSDQLGLEPDVNEWVSNLVAVCREIKRILKPGGGFWLNVADSYSHHPREGAPKKSLLLGPQRLALALVGDGWLLRNHIVRGKTNPMPSNVTDRLSNAHESVYFFTREQRYYFDLNAIRQPHRSRRVHAGGGGRVYPPPENLPRRSERSRDINDGLGRMSQAGLVGHPLGRNPGDVWQLGTAAYHGAHFATFPMTLVERPLLATCPEQVCVACGQPWQRAKQQIDGRWLAVGPLRADCSCRAAWKPGVVLDCFAGSGTVALAAEQHGRDWIGIELNPAYAALAKQRLDTWRAKRTKR
jgi:site-specific DNA-methyltransferase (adenine-specific)